MLMLLGQASLPGQRGMAPLRHRVGKHRNCVRACFSIAHGLWPDRARATNVLHSWPAAAKHVSVAQPFLDLPRSVPPRDTAARHGGMGKAWVPEKDLARRPAICRSPLGAPHGGCGYLSVLVEAAPTSRFNEKGPETMTTKTPQPFDSAPDTTEALQRAVNFWGESIHTYTRSQAIADGLLVDVSELAAEAGFRLPVALTRGVYTDCVKWSDERRQTFQSETGRLWDVLFLAALSARRGRGDRLTFRVNRVPRNGVAIRPEEVILQMRIGPGDMGEPVITVMQLDED